MPPVMGLIMDSSGTAAGFVVPAVCLAVVAAYALFDLRSKRHAGALVTEAAAH
jgi:FHS family L-fucose permease-like MFS transporter